MTQDTNTPQDATNVKTAKRARKPRAERTPFADIIKSHASKKGIDAGRAGKDVRSFSRREFDRIAKLDPTLLKAKTHANDGNRWPALNDAARTFILTRGKSAK